MITEEQFWQIVAELEWPTHHYDATKLTFMDRWPLETAGDFLDHFLNAKAALDRAAGEQWICDSWDDTKAHVVGLGRAAWQAHIDDPSLLRRRMDRYNYVESFAYCIPTSHDYALLADDGYTRVLRRVEQKLEELRSIDPDDISPRLQREIAAFETVAVPLLEQRWQDAVQQYHQIFGPGYADQWPSHLGYVLPNIVSDLEVYRLRARVPEWNKKENNL